ncbi:hypothetical protein BSL78_27487 [Apostichopus japonicus]|uniref:Tyr recombinase domain-containing protein n=1 Tax=Stichopus japonicus TaxID=307972 RepID=A0A2G8JIZ5_STIJA|nr:hypothetical protein BSL78_27487 [Apostichopus japonicus]
MSLFILPRAPFSTVSKDTLSRWLMEIIRPFAVGTTLTRAHDIRGKAASTALFAGVPIEVILKAAAWRTPTTFVACYLSDSLQAEAAFRSVVMRDPAGTRSHPSGLPPSGSATRCIGWGRQVSEERSKYSKTYWFGYLRVTSLPVSIPASLPRGGWNTAARRSGLIDLTKHLLAQAKRPEERRFHYRTSPRTITYCYQRVCCKDSFILTGSNR